MRWPQRPLNSPAGPGRPQAQSQAAGQWLEPALTRSRLSGPVGHLPAVFIQRQGQLVEELGHKETSTAQTPLINERPENSTSGRVTRYPPKGRANLQGVHELRSGLSCFFTQAWWAQTIICCVPNRTSLQASGPGQCPLHGSSACAVHGARCLLPYAML